MKLWKLATPATLATRPVLVPDPATAVLIRLADWPQTESGLWALDVASRMRSQVVDWEQLVDAATRRALAPACLSGLRYLRDELAQPAPDAAIGALSRAPVSVGEKLKFWVKTGEGAPRSLVEKAANRLADRLLAGRGYQLDVPDRRAVGAVRAQLLRVRRLLAHASQVPLPAEQDAQRHGLILRGDPRPRRLIVRISILRPDVSRRVFFDVSADGIAIARLRCRAGGGRQRIRAQLLFQLPLPGSFDDMTEIIIAARPVQLLPDNASPDRIAAAAPLPFTIVGAWVTHVAF